MNCGYYQSLYFKIWIENGICCFRYNTEALTLPVAKHLVQARIELCEQVTYPVVADIRAIKSVEPSASHFLACEESVQLIAAGAIITANQFHKIAGNFFILFDKPKVPARLFSVESEALAWLQQFKKARMTG
jgi:hypothetical protein